MYIEMKKTLLALMLMVGGLAASAQYFCTDQGKVMLYKAVDKSGKDSVESVIQATTVGVETAADGKISVRLQEIQSDPDNPLAEIKTYSTYIYDPQTDVSTIIPMSADDFKNFILTMIKDAAAANGQSMSEMDLADIEKVMSTKGQIEFTIDPKAEVASKIPNSTLRLSAGQLSMSMNFWEGKFLGAESVTTEAGTFDCVKISYVMRTSSPSGNEKRNVTAWYAKGIGLVRSVDTDKKGDITAEQNLFVIKEPKPAE